MKEKTGKACELSDDVLDMVIGGFDEAVIDTDTVPGDPGIRIQFVKIPYQVKIGDTLSKLAARFHTTALEIAETNGFSLQTELRPGSWITIPMHVR